MKHNSNPTRHGARRAVIIHRNGQQFSGRRPVEDPTARVSALLRAARPTATALRAAAAYGPRDALSAFWTTHADAAYGTRRLRR
jgi:hypothetical protein